MNACHNVFEGSESTRPNSDEDAGCSYPAGIVYFQ
jgi:hypothetical protein